ncbi:MAG TPA: hypothetical protein VEG38_16190, partial [Acidimicrobiia bacterium]|nr:hypothetical protein [Acidimicrobiia bacterium]
LSTAGDFAAGDDVSGRDEDIFACHGFRSGASSGCDNVSLAFNGSSVGLGGDNEDIDAFSFTGEGNVEEGAAFFSALGPYRLSTASGGKADVFSCVFPEEPPDAGPLASCGGPDSPVHTVFSDESHLVDENIMALEFQY